MAYFFVRLHDHQNLDVLEIPQLICTSGENYRSPNLTMMTNRLVNCLGGFGQSGLVV